MTILQTRQGAVSHPAAENPPHLDTFTPRFSCNFYFAPPAAEFPARTPYTTRALSPSSALIPLSVHWPITESNALSRGSMTAQGLLPMPSLHWSSQLDAQQMR